MSIYLLLSGLGPLGSKDTVCCRARLAGDVFIPQEQEVLRDLGVKPDKYLTYISYFTCNSYGKMPFLAKFVYSKNIDELGGTIQQWKI